MAKFIAGRRLVLWWASLALLATAVAVAMMAISGPLYRHQVIALASAFNLLGKGFWVGMGAAAAGLVGIVIGIFARRGLAIVLAFVALVGAVVAAGWLYELYLGAKTVPPIHGVATDPLTPPQFVTLAATRLNPELSPDGLQYGHGSPALARAEVQALAHFFGTPIGRASNGRDAAVAACTQWTPACLAAVQRAYFPDLRPLVAPATSPAQGFAAALATARAMGWKIVAGDATSEHFEATATSVWFGFKDDIAVEVAPQGGGCVINVRSESRVGLSDLGKNAARVRNYLARLKSRLHGASS